jgi:hypothetical protein
VFLIAGAIVSTCVAFLCVRISPVHPTNFVAFGPSTYASSNLGSMRVSRAERFGASRTRMIWNPKTWYASEQDGPSIDAFLCGYEKIFAGRIFATQTTSGSETVIDARGWPLPCLAWSDAMTEDPIVVSSGFVGNAVLYASVAWVIVFAPRAFKRRRRRHLRCVQCGYPVGVSPVCTECGCELEASGSGRGAGSEWE